MAKYSKNNLLNLLREYEPQTFGIQWDTGYPGLQEAIDNNYVQWYPGLFGGSQWAITEQGRQYVKEHENDG